MPLSSAPLLAVRDVTMRFGGIVALDAVSFDMAAGHIVGLIGPNGAGKTTLFNCVSRLYTPSHGDVLFAGASIIRDTPHHVAALGIGRTFQNLALFPTMTVLQNVMVGAHAMTGTDFLSNALRLPWVTREERRMREAAMEVIAFLGLEPRGRAISPRDCPSARSSGWSWRAPWRAGRSSCSSTSRQAG